MSCDKKLSVSKLKKFMKEEHESAEEYRRLGFKSQARDEARHSKFFKKKIAEIKKKKSLNISKSKKKVMRGKK